MNQNDPLINATAGSVPAPLLAAMKKTLGAQELISASLQRQAGLCARAPQMLLHWDQQTWNEWLEMQQAIMKRTMQLQQQWQEQQQQYVEECGQIRKVNTMSKLMEQEMNLLLQCGAMLTKQMTDCVMLFENVQSNMAYWLSQKTPPQD